MEELSFHPSSSAQTPPPGGDQPTHQQQENNNNNNNGFFNAMPQMHHHQYFQQPYPQHFNHQMHYPQSRFMHHPHPFGNVQRGTQFSPRARVGDWMCPNSCGLVFSSKTNCFRCGVLKPPGSVRLIPLHMRTSRSVSMSFPYPSHSWF